MAFSSRTSSKAKHSHSTGRPRAAPSPLSGYGSSFQPQQIMSPPPSPVAYSALPPVSADIYSASGLDVMGILLQIFSRPHPQVHLGPVDCSCSFVICDLYRPDTPILYASDAFTQLTGYSKSEVLGRNPRFMQKPPARQDSRTGASHGGGWGGGRGRSAAVAAMKDAVERNREVQLQVRNYKKSGREFVNLLSIIPVPCEDGTCRYSVGFMAEER